METGEVEDGGENSGVVRKDLWVAVRSGEAGGERRKKRRRVSFGVEGKQGTVVVSGFEEDVEEVDQGGVAAEDGGDQPAEEDIGAEGGEGGGDGLSDSGEGPGHTVQAELPPGPAGPVAEPPVVVRIAGPAVDPPGRPLSRLAIPHPSSASSTLVLSPGSRSPNTGQNKSDKQLHWSPQPKTTLARSISIRNAILVIAQCTVQTRFITHYRWSQIAIDIIR